MLLVTAIMLTLYLLIRYDTARTNKEVQKKKDAFWKRERDANETRKQDLSSIDYIKIPLDSLPFMETEDSTLQSIQHSMRELSQKSILNLTGISNTDLKLKYGVANIPFLSSCDSNYNLLINNLYKWANQLYHLGEAEKAKTVLEYGIQCGTDMSKHFILLANIYKEQNTIHKIDQLIISANSLNTLMKHSIVTSLREIKNSIYLE